MNNTTDSPRQVTDYRQKRESWLMERGATEAEARKITDAARAKYIEVAVELAEHLVGFHCDDEAGPDQMAWMMAKNTLNGLRQNRSDRSIKRILREGYEFPGRLPTTPMALGWVLRGALAVLRSHIFAGIRPTSYL